MGQGHRQPVDDLGYEFIRHAQYLINIYVACLIQRAGAVSTDLESNLQNVEVKRAQAKSGVNKHLEKLRQLKRGGGE